MVVAVLMTAIACAWSIAICWKLALVGIAVAPIFYALSRGFEIVSSAWERRRIGAIQEVVRLFSETFVNIRTVKAMSMESQFKDKCLVATRQARRIGLKKALASGVLYGAAEASSTLVTGQ
jgi:ATP-binding cassette subfamily B (MDR/TAP) protein 1